MDALSQNKEEYPLGSARPFFEMKAGWITGKSDAACFVLGRCGDAGLLRQDKKRPVSSITLIPRS